jgi:N-acetyl-anhydromuramyl-L-alanine amidase AmpD
MKIRTKLVDFGFSVPSKPRSIDTIVLHSSYDSLGDDPYSIEGIIDIYKSYGVSAHYLIARDGTIYRLVKDENIAYHAGVSKVPDGRTNVNDFSIGIEIVNTKTSDYTSEQYASVKRLIASLKDKYVIKYVLGHDAIAPGRKTDPWNFAWKQL